MNTVELEQNLRQGYQPDAEMLTRLAQTLLDEELFGLAYRLRLHFQGRRVDTCSIMNARSGRCSEDCKWCAQSRFYRSRIETYPLKGADEAVGEAKHNAAKGVGRFSLVTSGRTMTDTEIDRICDTYRRLKNEVPIALCASLGLLSREQLARLRESGVTRYHCNLETAPSHFGTLCTTHTIQEKLQTIAWAREVGLEICSGGIIGMGESEAQRIEFAVALRSTGAVSVPVNVLNPIPGTPMENTPPLSDRKVLRAIALMRIAHPGADIRLAGGRSVIRHIEERALQAGVSALITGDMLTTTGSDIESDRALATRCGFNM